MSFSVCPNSFPSEQIAAVGEMSLVSAVTE